ncbi:uncharacterized protein LY89DRAFT_764936 [Mollisia scopiformis]|uniref:Uncharacterized protein n=1 Tax=Mollisia scopiformis TaxID=149040 RepID=A0A132B6W6_MOLSC|nr:uncharacterized protein LY89DRAFT_764936 [Mollisia scopiformis]KUJ08155.1 hypothetical protein LY89DRAFT_764936 [Mollisia scopiformis]
MDNFLERMRNIERQMELNQYREREQRRAAEYDSILAGRGRSHIRGDTSYKSEDDEQFQEFLRRHGAPSRERRSSPSQRLRSSFSTFPQFSGNEQNYYNSEDDDLPEEFRRRRSPPQPRRRSPSPEPRCAYRSCSPPPRQAYSPPPRRAHSSQPRHSSPPPRTAYAPPPPRVPSPPPRRGSPPPSHTRPRTSFREENPHGIYTYSDEEPEKIPIAPAAWNNYASSIGREKLISFFKSKGVPEALARSEVDKEFAAHARKHRAGES